MAVMRVGTKKKLPEGLGTRARAWPEGGMLAGPADAWRKMGGGGGDGGREVLGEGDPSGIHPAPFSSSPHPLLVTQRVSFPNPPLSLSSQGDWPSGEWTPGWSAERQPGHGQGTAVGPTRRLMTCPPSTPLHASGPAS